MDFKTLITQITTLFANLNKKQKIIIGASTLAAIAFIVFLVLYTSSKGDAEDGYRVLFSKLSASDSARVITQLENDNIPYKIVNEGTIKVPKDAVYKERITIASQGIPQNTKVGFELFDTQNFGETDFAQNIKYLRALEGELERTIQALNPIEDASVKIALPKESLFVEEKVEPTASVLLKLKENMRLTHQQAAGIRNLISAAVPKLKPENVKLIDQNGNPIDESLTDGFSPQEVSTQLEYKRKFEKEMERKIIKILSPIIGSPKRVSAKVTAEFDFNQRRIHDEHYDPDSVVRSEQSMEEKREGGKSNADASGVPGAISNISPTKPLGKNSKSNEKYNKSTTTTNYEISKTVTDTKGEFAKLTRVTAAVVVDGKYEKDPKNKEKLKYTPLPPETIKRLEEIVKQTIGFNAKRGDGVTVSNMQFKKDEKEQESKIEKSAKMITLFLPLLKYLFAAILLFIFYKKIIAPFSERMIEDFSAKYDEEEEELPPEEEEPENNEALDKYAKMKRKLEMELGLAQDVDEETLRHTIMTDKMRESVNENPEELAKLIEAIMRDDKGL